MKFVLLISLFISSIAIAQAPRKRARPVKALPSKKSAVSAPSTPEPGATPVPVHLDARNSMRITYGYPAWNKSPTKIDTASMIMREGVTGRVVQIHLVETEPDSSIFSGLYSINFQNLEKLKVEFYVPPQDLLESTGGLKKIAAMISSNQLKRNPFILRRPPVGTQSIEVFDTREQAQMALKAYKAEQQLQGLQNAKFPSDQQIEMANLSKELQERMAMSKAATERVRLEQVEASRLAATLAKESALNSAQKQQRKKEAEKLAAEALALYRESRFADASARFEKVLELDPENKSYYFQYGVALTKSEQANKALVFLNLADGPNVNKVEKDFFVGLNHMRLKDSANAIQAFDRVAVAKMKEVSSAALFYKGVIHFEDKKWDDARGIFQAVLDTSDDPALDSRAESYIEQILRVQQFEAERARKWQLSATLGGQYDSNITLVSDSTLSQGSASNVDGYRSLFQGTARYRPVYETTREFAIQTDFLMMYTVDKDLQYRTSLRNADPILATLTLPWTYKGLMFGKGYKLDVIPGYESIWMSIEDNTNKEIISSFVLNTTNLFIMNDRLFSNFNLELRQDQSKLKSSTGNDDSSATKAKIVNSNLHFVSDDKSRILTSEAGLSFNQALGKNATYQRLDLAVGFIQPFYWETSAISKIGYYYLSYPQKSDNRIDNDYALTLGLSKKLNDSLNLGFVGNYTINNSSADASTYKKWTTMVTLSTSKAF